VPRSRFRQSDEDTQLKDRGELCGQEQMSKDSDLDVQEHAPTPSPPKSGKGKSELENHPVSTRRLRPSSFLPPPDLLL
jgi:hypothetical protein